MRFSSVGSLSFALVLGLGWQADTHAQSERNVNLAPSAVFFNINGAESGTFSIGAESGGTAVTYNLANKEVSFRLFDSVDAGLDNPLFCFDFAAPSANPQLRLKVRGAGEQIALDSINLTSALQYRLTGTEIIFSPSSSVQCFYTGDGADPVFGLFGRLPPEPLPGPADRFFHDRFQDDGAQPGLSIRFENMPSTAAAGELLEYKLIVENTGGQALTQIAFQEAFAGNESVHGAALNFGAWFCNGIGGAQCPASAGTGPIRFVGRSLQPGQRLEFLVRRDAFGPAGAAIALFAGAVNGPGSNAPFDVDQASFVISSND